MIETRYICQVYDAFCGTRFGIGSPKYQLFDTCQQHSAKAHRTRLQRHIQYRTREPIILQLSGSLAQS